MSSEINTPAIPSSARPEAFIAQPNIRSLNARDLQGDANDKKLDKTLKDFEAVFISQMFSHMYEGVGVDPMFGGGMGEETMRTLLINEYGKKMADAGGIGMAEQMKKQLLAAQEQQAAPKTSQNDPKDAGTPMKTNVE